MTAREVGREASVGEHTGQPLSPVKIHIPVRPYRDHFIQATAPAWLL